MFIKVLLNLLS